MNRFSNSLFKWGNRASWSYADTLRSRRSDGGRPLWHILVARIIADAALLAFLMLCPWWLTLALAIIYFLVFSLPAEAVLTIIGLDIVSGGVYFAAGAIIALPFLIWIKRRIRV